ncbi:MAG TPA: site-2 protease family protein [Candidatus Binataceae bacterium]|nr:site-2 protease family protein [Candidatus Binataceae bacterium]
MEDFAAHSSAPVLTDIPRYSAPTEAIGPREDRPAIPPLNLALFWITMFTTTMIGGTMAGGDYSLWHPLHSIASLAGGLSFSLPLMAILLAHEMGHYLTARANNVNTSLPYFIPAPPVVPFIIGTFGAFIRMREVPKTRRVMFDIGAAGPWAGAIIAIPLLIIGLKLSSVTPLENTAGGGIELGNSILFWSLSRLVLGVNPATVNVNLHATAFAGWIGLLVTTLNLLPVGQLDGGHVIYALFPRAHRRIGILFIVFCGAMVLIPYLLDYEFWAGWLLWGVLALMLGVGHPATVDRDTPLDPLRRRAAWATIVLFLLTFSPVPVSFSQPPASQDQQAPQNSGTEVIYHAHANPWRHLPNVRI